jgi:hypothetical protein
VKPLRATAASIVPAVPTRRLVLLGLAAAAVARVSPARADEEPVVSRHMTTTWRLGALYEFHHDTRPVDFPGAPRTDQALLLRAAVAFDGDDEIALSGLVRQEVVADSTESGLRAGDVCLSYSHRFRLPERFELTPALLVTFPVSYDAQFASNISAPGVLVTLARAAGDFSVSLSAFARYYWDKYISSASLSGLGDGNTNVKAMAGGWAAADYTMPFWRGLSVGVAILDVHSWFYDPGQPPSGTFAGGAVVQSPPVLENMGADAHVRVASTGGALRYSVTLGVGNTTAWETRLGGGIPLSYLGYSDVPDVYLALAMSYATD